jgi:dihydrofolate synthase/folylpolyglutamate synthase
VALAAVEAFAGVQLDSDLVRSAFSKVRSPGRCEVIHRDPTVIIDAAHNPHGAKAITNTINSEFDFETVIGVVAVLGDKDAAGILAELSQVVDYLVVSQSSSPRALPANELAKIAAQFFTNEGVSAVLVTGSVVSAGEARAIVRNIFGGN